MKKFEDENKRSKKGFSWKLFLAFLAFEIIFTVATGPLIVFYGPFQNVKKTIVGSAMNTMTHQWIATTFLSGKKIDEILGKRSVEVMKQDLNCDDVKISKKKDDTIEIEKIENKKFDGYMMIVKDPTRIRIAMTKKKDIEGQRTSQMAKDNNAIAAINGGSFVDVNSEGKWVGTGAFPKGIVMTEGKILFNDFAEGEARTLMAITKEGKLIVGERSLEELKKLDVQEALCYEPVLLVNGKVESFEKDYGTSPRTAIGQKEDGSILMLVIDGRNLLAGKFGATMEEVQKIMLKYGAVNAINLDGGSSATMYYNEEVINNPCDTLGERTIATAVYVK